VNVNPGSREVSIAPTPIPDAGQPEPVQDIAQPSELLVQDDATTLSLPDRPIPVLDDTLLSVEEEHAQLSLPTAHSGFEFDLMHIDAPVLATSMQPLFGHPNSDGTPGVAGELDPSSRFSMSPSTPTPSLASEWSNTFANDAMGYNGMPEAYINPMSQYVAGGQPIYCTYSHIIRALIVRLTSLQHMLLGMDIMSR
jgi:hypothetical protein